MKSLLFVIAILSLLLIAALPPEEPFTLPTPTPQVEGDVVFVSVMADGRVIDVRRRTLCQDTTVYGSPRFDGIARYDLPKGSVITTHELWGGWAMFKPAQWVPESVLCP